MSARAGVRLALGLSLVLLGPTASAQEHWSAAERNRIFATLPNWSGLWESKVSALSDNLTGYPANSFAATRKPSDIARLIPLLATPPYAPEWLRRQRARTKSKSPAASPQPGKLCTDVSFPALLELPLMFQAFVTPEETLFLYENGDARHIYTDGREHPKKDDLWPTKRGNSIGRWQGTTLVVDTIEVNSGPILGPGTADLSDRARFTERVRMLDANTMEDDLTIDDPVRFAHPWHVSTRWTRVLDQDRMLPFDCENDRNPVVSGKFSIAPPR
jgi:hypothetical protein